MSEAPVRVVLSGEVVETPLDRTMSARDISVTERGQFRSCRRRWTIETLGNWTPKQPKTALMFGDGIHRALEVFYECDGYYAEALQDALDEFDVWHKEAEDDLAEYLGPLFTNDAKEDLWELRNLGVTMLKNYSKYDEEQAHRDPWEIIAIEGRGLTYETLGGTPPYDKSLWPRIEEGRVVVPIVDADGKALPGNPCLSGRIDILARRFKRGDLYVIDHKTTASSPSDRGIDFEDQITGYCYIVWRLTGIVPRGTMFNYLVKQIPKEPRINKPTKKCPNGILSTAMDQLCLAPDYRIAMIEFGILNPTSGVFSEPKYREAYEAMLSKGWDPYFKRFTVNRNEQEVMNFERRLVEECADMSEVAANVELEGLTARRAYPNLSAWNCPSCSVAPICQAMEDGSDYESVIGSRYMQAPDRKAIR